MIGAAVARLLAVLLALALVVLGVLVPVEVVRALTDRPPGVLPWDELTRTLREHTWQQAGPRTVLVVVVVLGVLLLAPQLRRSRPDAYALAGFADDVTARITRPGLAASLRDAATSVPGVSDAEVSLRRRRARVTARSTLADSSAIAAQVREAVGNRVADLQLARPPRVRVGVREGAL